MTPDMFLVSTLSILIITTGAKHVSEMLKINQTLKYLNINSNPIGDKGIAVITRTLYLGSVSWLCTTVTSQIMVSM